MTPHQHGLHAQSDPTLRAIMADEQPPAYRARMMATQINGKLEAGTLRRLPISELVDLRGIVFGLDALATDITREREELRRAHQAELAALSRTTWADRAAWIGLACAGIGFGVVFATLFL